MAGEERWRLFVGAYPPEPVVRKFESAIARWKTKLEDPAIKWVSPEMVHLTLCFLGSVETSNIPMLKEALNGPALSHKEVSLSITGLGVFPHARQPRVLWAGISGGVRNLNALQRDVSKACAPFAAKPDVKSLTAHLTLARIDGADLTLVANLRTLIESNREKDFGGWDLREIQLIRSELGNKGSKYSLVRRFSLGGRT